LNIFCARHGVSSDIGQLPAQEEEEEEEKKKIETTQSASIPVSAAAATATTFVAESIVSVIPGVLSFESTPSTIVETLDSGFNASSTSSSSSTSAFDDSSDLFRRLNSDKVPALDGLLPEPVDSFNNQQESTSDTVPVGISVSIPLSEESRQAELASIALALSSVEASLREKELLIEQFVSQENYDEADKIQVDLDSLLAHKESLIRREEELNQ
jgi:hypothetical protein